MVTRRHAIVATLATLALPRLLPAASSPDDWLFSLGHAGLLRIGMTFNQVLGQLGDLSFITEPEDEHPDPDGCRNVNSTNLPDSVGMIFYKKRLARVATGSSKYGHTDAGARVGDSESRVKSLYAGQLEISAHPYVDDGHYFVYKSNRPALNGLSIIFETDGKVVTSFRTGRAPANAWIEGCE